MSTIQDIHIAAGLKEALLNAGITLEQLIDSWSRGDCAHSWY